MSHRRHRRAGPGRPKPGGPVCAACGKGLQGLKLYYKVAAQVTCEPNELSFSAEDLEKDHAAEMERISRECEGRDPKELEEEVCVLLDYHLCVGCKKEYVRKVRGG